MRRNRVGVAAGEFAASVRGEVAGRRQKLASGRFYGNGGHSATDRAPAVRSPDRNRG